MTNGSPADPIAVLYEGSTSKGDAVRLDGGVILLVRKTGFLAMATAYILYSTRTFCIGLSVVTQLEDSSIGIDQ